MRDARGKHIIVTGASSGIGAAVAAHLAGQGHAVYACARRAQRLRELSQRDPRIVGHPCDVAQEAQVQIFCCWVKSRTPTIDALINCAGSFGAIGAAIETESQAWLQTIETNLFGTYLMIKHAAPMMIRECSPRIVNCSGGGAFAPFPYYSAYAVSKAGIVRLTETLAAELAPRGIAINAVAPGFVATEIHEATLREGSERAGSEHFEQTQRLLRQGAVPVERVVACIAFLLSEQAHGLTGKTISASFDPWGTPSFADQMTSIMQSDLYTMRRINLADLPESPLRHALSNARQDANTAGVCDQPAQAGR